MPENNERGPAPLDYEAKSARKRMSPGCIIVLVVGILFAIAVLGYMVLMFTVPPAFHR